MKVFLIERPYVSAGLKRTYHKKLEVFEGTATETGEHYFLSSIQFLYTYTKKGGWVKKAHTKIPTSYRPFLALKLFTTTNTTRTGFYTTLEAAQASKLILIQRLEERYRKAIKELEDTFARNVPAYKEPLNQLLDQYPDLFI